MLNINLFMLKSYSKKYHTLRSIGLNSGADEGAKTDLSSKCRASWDSIYGDAIYGVHFLSFWANNRDSLFDTEMDEIEHYQWKCLGALWLPFKEGIPYLNENDKEKREEWKIKQKYFGVLDGLTHQWWENHHLCCCWFVSLLPSCHHPTTKHVRLVSLKMLTPHCHLVELWGISLTENKKQMKMIRKRFATFSRND